MLRWEFIKDTLEDISLPQIFVPLIWHCISSAKMKLIWNGEVMEEFSPSWGIRRGDPISPYLFVMCIKRLFHLAFANNIKRCIPISHLAFANDIILFAEASVEQVQVIKHILQTFCECYGQRASQAKTKIFFSRNVDRQTRWNTGRNLASRVTDDLGKYLRVPIFHQRVTKDAF